MKHSNKYQHYALDVNNNIINIRDTLKTKNEEYFCPHCHKEMITKRGNIRQWHFAHKTDKCSYDKYLHSLAEIMIMDWFNSKDKIVLSLLTDGKCDKSGDCVFFNEKDCTGQVYDDCNLKKYYSKCVREKKYKDFVADLYCEKENNPLFIEIFVTHKCSEEKKLSGIRIIEIGITSEEDIFNITNSNVLKESDNIRLYNFKRNKML